MYVFMIRVQQPIVDKLGNGRSQEKLFKATAREKARQVVGANQRVGPLCRFDLTPGNPVELKLNRTQIAFGVKTPEDNKPADLRGWTGIAKWHLGEPSEVRIDMASAREIGAANWIVNFVRNVIQRCGWTILQEIDTEEPSTSSAEPSQRPDPNTWFTLAGGEPIRDARTHSGGVPEELVRYALARIKAKQGLRRIRFEFKNVIGEKRCMLLRTKDICICARRDDRPWETRFVVNREPEPTRVLALVTLIQAGQHVFLSSYFGNPVPPDPEDTTALQWEEDPRRARQLASEFWATHALILGTLDIRCPGCGNIIPKNQARAAFDGVRIMCADCRRKTAT